MWVDMLREALLPFHALGTKVGATMTAAGSATAVATPMITEIMGLTLDEWKVITMILGMFTGIAGVLVQIFFKWLDRRDKLQHYAGLDRRRG